MEELCRIYWYPLYSFIRRQGHGAEDARDLTQELFAQLLERRFLEDVSPEKGRFRSFLLASCRHFLANEQDRVTARKRGGGRSPVPLHLLSAEQRYRVEPRGIDPEQLFERGWALRLLEEVLGRLQQDEDRRGRGGTFERLKPFLSAEGGVTSYRQLAAELGATEGALKVAVHRLRRRYRELLREEIARTVADPEAVSDELRFLTAVLARPAREEP